MAEEQKWQKPGGHRLCANNCGFFGSPTTLNLCSKCYKDYRIKEQQMKEAKLAMENTLSTQPESSSDLVSAPPTSSSSRSNDVSIGSGLQNLKPFNVETVAEDATPPNVAAAKLNNRCATCRKRVGLTGFTCRCGVTFCGSHRYPEQHGCTFDYKALGREEIAKANPVVKAGKLDKI